MVSCHQQTMVAFRNRTIVLSRTQQDRRWSRLNRLVSWPFQVERYRHDEGCDLHAEELPKVARPLHVVDSSVCLIALKLSNSIRNSCWLRSLERGVSSSMCKAPGAISSRGFEPFVEHQSVTRRVAFHDLQKCQIDFFSNVIADWEGDRVVVFYECRAYHV